MPNAYRVKKGLLLHGRQHVAGQSVCYAEVSSLQDQTGRKPAGGIEVIYHPAVHSTSDFLRVARLGCSSPADVCPTAFERLVQFDGVLIVRRRSGEEFEKHFDAGDLVGGKTAVRPVLRARSVYHVSNRPAK